MALLVRTPLPFLAVAVAVLVVLARRIRTTKAWFPLAMAGAAVSMVIAASIAARDPAAVLLDSDLDWGQGLLQLRRELQARGVTDLAIAHAGFTDPCRVGLPHLRALAPGQPATGWIAISENYYRRRSHLLLRRDPCDLSSTYRPNEIPPHPFAWLEAHQPVTIVAGSIRLYQLR